MVENVVEIVVGNVVAEAVENDYQVMMVGVAFAFLNWNVRDGSAVVVDLVVIEREEDLLEVHKNQIVDE